MLIPKLEEGKIYRNSRGHLVLLNGRHICYIDIKRDAIVYVMPGSLRGDDWEVLSVEKEGTASFDLESDSAPKEKRGRGRPRKVQP